jgi:hypothetical protein
VAALPGFKYIGSAPAWPVATKKQMTKARMSDSSIKIAFFGTRKVFQIRSGYLTNAELAIFKVLNELNQILLYRNEFEENVEYRVVIIDFTHDPERMDARQLDRYKISMTLEETDNSLRT